MRKYIITIITMFTVVAGCDYSDVTVSCDGANCWATAPSWDSWARAITSQQIADAEGSGALVPSPTVAGDQCWTVAGGESHACIVYVGTARLFGRPAAELPLGDPGLACHFKGAWEYNARAYGLCFGVMDGVAVQLDIDPF